MYLKSLEIFGFKSFPEKTILKFEPGITVIVGPNGCGKSNIFDAIKWALGEQSPKSLRGSKMEDVIFNGTENHPPLSYTEVTLTFSNEDNYLPIDYKEVSITRKLYRSGESEYFINKNPVRLKDIQELFMGTGIGESTYSFIEQGKVEIFLSYKPEDKRLMFDEASGIVKYKEKKKEALKKLKDTEENLLRLEDIMGEVNRQIRYLQRQVEKAKKYREIEAELIKVEKKIASINYKNIEEKRHLLSKEEEDLKRREKEEEEFMESLREKYREIQKELEKARLSLEEISTQTISFNSKIEIYHNNIENFYHRIEDMKKRLEDIDREIKALDEKLILQHKRIDEGRRELENLDEKVESLHRLVKDLKDEKEKKSEKIESLESEIKKTKEDIIFHEAERVRVNNELVEINTSLKALYSRRKRLLLDRARLDGIFKEKEDSVESKNEELITLEEEVSKIKEEKNSLESEISKYESLREHYLKDKLEKEKALVELNSYKEFLKNLQIKYNSFSTKKVRIIFNEPPHQVNKLIASFEGLSFYTKQEQGITNYIFDVDARVILFKEEDIQKRIQEIEEALSSLENNLKNVEDRCVELEESHKAFVQRIFDLEKSLAEKRREKESLYQEFVRIKEEVELLDSEIEQIEREIKETEQKKTEQEKALSLLQERLTELENILENNQNQKSTLVQEINTIQTEIAKSEAQLSSFENIKADLIKRLSLLEEDKISILTAKNKLSSEGENIIDSISSLNEEIEKHKKRIDEAKEKILNLEEEKRKAEEMSEKLEGDLKEVATCIEEKGHCLEEIRNKLNEIRLNLQKLEFEKSKIFDYIRQVYNEEFKPEETEGNLELLLQEKEKLQKRLGNLGEVNLVAIEEFEELNKRYKFLETQKNDLVKSKEELKKIISKINKTSREVFLDTFHKINEEFKKLFRYLFGGGRARLVLVDEENVLESGVEIEVQPPGKKLQNISLLSGGEKALSAIALIFSIFKIRPTPVCILDEIDAPLDDANVERFNTLLKDFASRSQFIVITHNKRTMSNADILYGVTMQEKGISRLVSVKFATQTQEASS